MSSPTICLASHASLSDDTQNIEQSNSYFSVRTMPQGFLWSWSFTVLLQYQLGTFANVTTGGQKRHENVNVCEAGSFTPLSHVASDGPLFRHLNYMVWSWQVGNPASIAPQLCPNITPSRWVDDTLTCFALSEYILSNLVYFISFSLVWPTSLLLALLLDASSIVTSMMANPSLLSRYIHYPHLLNYCNYQSHDEFWTNGRTYHFLSPLAVAAPNVQPGCREGAFDDFDRHLIRLILLLFCITGKSTIGTYEVLTFRSP